MMPGSAQVVMEARSERALQHVRIEAQETGAWSRVFIDGQQVLNVMDIRVHVGVDCETEVQMTFLPAEVEIEGDVPVQAIGS